MLTPDERFDDGAARRFPHLSADDRRHLWRDGRISDTVRDGIVAGLALLGALAFIAYHAWRSFS